MYTTYTSVNIMHQFSIQYILCVILSNCHIANFSINTYVDSSQRQTIKNVKNQTERIKT